jgi:hypothetical protein
VFQVDGRIDARSTRRADSLQRRARRCAGLNRTPNQSVMGLAQRLFVARDSLVELGIARAMRLFRPVME